jgi:hypothetical protein
MWRQLAKEYDKETSPDLLAVHGTILTLVAGFLAAYLTYCSSKIDEQFQKALQSALAVHTLRNGLTFGGLKASPLFGVATDAGPLLDELQNILNKTATTWDNPELGDRVEEITQVVPWAWPFGPINLTFQDIEALERWHKSLHSCAGSLISQFTGDARPPQVTALIKAAARAYLAKSNADPKFVEAWSEQFATTKVAVMQAFAKSVAKLNDDVWVEMRLYEQVKETHTPSRLIQIALYSTVFTFFFSIIVPISCGTRHWIFVVFIPTLYYLAAVVFVLSHFKV